LKSGHSADLINQSGHSVKRPCASLYKPTIPDPHPERGLARRLAYNPTQLSRRVNIQADFSVTPHPHQPTNRHIAIPPSPHKTHWPAAIDARRKQLVYNSHHKGQGLSPAQSVLCRKRLLHFLLPRDDRIIIPRLRNADGIK
jgi:hypothetical protein